MTPRTIERAAELCSMAASNVQFFLVSDYAPFGTWRHSWASG